MDNNLIRISDRVIENYNIAKEKLRFDGEYLNHFLSLIIDDTVDSEEISIIKNIRKYIKENTMKTSSFRGEVLYIISILISKEDDYIEFSKKLIKVHEDLLEEGFKESDYLVLSAYSIAKHCTDEEKDLVYEDMKLIYVLLKNKFKDVTNEDDYLICALLSIKCIKENEDPIKRGFFIESMFNYLIGLEKYSKNDLQLIAGSTLLNESASAQYGIKDFMKAFRVNDIKLGDEMLSMVGTATRDGKIDEYVQSTVDIMNYLKEEDIAYDYYMNKTFMAFIGISVLEKYRKGISLKYNKFLDELISFSTLSFIMNNKHRLLDKALV